MNKQFWNKIKKDYPFAYEKWAHDTLCSSQFMAKRVGTNLRDLYDFFDKKRIIVEIQCENSTQWQSIVWNIFNNDNEVEILKYYESRQQAEKAAFKKAFKILNNQLKDK